MAVCVQELRVTMKQMPGCIIDSINSLLHEFINLRKVNSIPFEYCRPRLKLVFFDSWYDCGCWYECDIVLFLKFQNWHILSHRETPYVIYRIIYLDVWCHHPAPNLVGSSLAEVKRRRWTLRSSLKRDRWTVRPIVWAHETLLTSYRHWPVCIPCMSRIIIYLLIWMFMI